MIFRKTALGLAAGLIAAVGAAQASAITGQSTSIIGTVNYEGFGDDGSGRGTGRYTAGNCSFDGMNTTCITTGDFVQNGDSADDPGGTGTFTFTQTFSGTVSPVLARSVTPGSNSLVFTSVGDAIFELTLTTNDNDVFTGIFPDDPFENSINFSLFLGNVATCTGLGMVPCSISNVGLTPGATITGATSLLAFSIPVIEPSPVPVPGALPLMAAGLAGVFGMRRKRS
ncbi:MAG: PEP-CTERM sorting domain-containing protein [Pseudomonadota bacterium]